jgi:hypothetical protein
MTSADNLKDLRKKAQEAVADMPNGELKTKAFEVFLQHLLASQSISTSSVHSAHKPATGKEKSSKKAGSTKSRILLLREEGFFAVPRSISEVKGELQAHGWIHPMTGLSGPLQGLVRDRELRRLKGQGDKKKGWKYVNP